MSLRNRLVVGTLLLLIAAIVVTDVVMSSYLRSFLTGRLDEQIDVAQSQAYTYIYEAQRRAVSDHETLATSAPQVWLSQLSTTADPSCVPPGTPATTVPGGPPSTGTQAEPVRSPRLNGAVLASLLNPDVYTQVITASGIVVFEDPSGTCARPDPPPLLPKRLPVQAVPLSHVFGRSHGVYVPDRPSFEVPELGARGVHYRVQAVAVPGGTLVTAIALDPMSQTLTSLMHVEIGVSIAVVCALLVLVLWTVRFGLRPLHNMTETARAIAGGDLTRRIQRADERSEVGRLGAALNGMLSQIEAAFRARASSESRLRRFVADASHELRTPLTSIRGYAELLRKGAFADEAARKRASQRIEHEAERMSLLVEDMLLLARLDQGRPFERSEVHLGEVVSDAVDAARAVDTTRPVSLDVDGGAVVEGDAARLRQLIDNLLRNAEVHTPPGTPVHVRVNREDGRALVSVSDEGPGIEPGEQGKVFDRFYRGNAARTGGGSGLGLSIVAAIAAAHGGRTWVDSTPGRGSTFGVELPAQPSRPAGAPTETTTGEQDPSGPPTATQGTGGSMSHRP